MGHLDWLYVHTATVETFRGNGINGPDYATGVAIACYIDAQDVVMATGDGTQVTQRKTMLYADISHGSLLTAQSKVTSAQLGDDGVARVASTNLLDTGSLGLGLDHVEATLQ